MEINIDTSKFDKLINQEMEKSIKSAVKNQLDYWVRQELHKRIADELITNIAKEYFPKERLEEILKDEFKQWVWEKLNVEKYEPDY